MGREIRRVPPNWEHPSYTQEDAKYNSRHRVGEYKPMFDKDYDSAAKEWIEGFNKFVPTKTSKYYWEYDSTPDEECYRPAFTEEPTWFQVYETVSEGTPVTPPFATEDELIQYLVENGDFWYQKRDRYDQESLPTIEQATAFVKGGWAPSMVVIQDATGISIKSGIQAAF